MIQGDEFATALLQRIGEARTALREAVESSNQAAVSQALDELERALLLARENGIEVPAQIGGQGEKDGS